MALKQFNVKHAERWLEKLKNQNLQSYKDITKFLRKYQKTDDQHDCYLKMSHTLLSHVDLTKEINLFLTDGNKFVISRPDDEKLKDFMGYVKKNRPQVFNRIISMIQELSKSKGEGNSDVSKLIIPKLKEIVKGDLELERLTEQALDMTDQQIIRKKNLEHLKMYRPFVPMPEEAKDMGPSQSQPLAKQVPKTFVKQPKPVDISVIEKEKKNMKQALVVNLTNSVEEKVALKQFRRNIDQTTDRHIMKVLKIYTLNIITRNQALQLLNIPAIEDQFFELLRDIIETRELDRRKQSIFKPLGDINFSSYERCSPSYVNTPITYPTKCSGKTAEIRAITNDKWISVPYGSEQNENFSVRNKNTNEINLLKAEDERYEYHLYFKKLWKTKELLEKYLDQKNNLNLDERELLLSKVINLGIVQIIYKNSKDEQKEEIENFIRYYPKDTCKTFLDKIDNEIAELKAIKEIHAIKTWNQIANKNFYKALDLKGFEFKKNEKEKLKNTFFMSQLNERSKLLQNGGETKVNIRFEQKKQFFSVFNSFSSSSRTEKCNNRTLPSIDSFDLKDVRKRSYYPLMILSFQDEETCKQVYSLLIYYIEAAQITESQKYKSKVFLEQFLIGFLGWKVPTKKMLSTDFNQEVFFQKLNNMEMPYDCSKFFTPETQIAILKLQQLQKFKGDEGKEKKMYTLDDADSRYSYFPKRSEGKKVLYCSQQVYCLVRYLYTLYQRLLKLKQVAQSEQHIQLFELLFYSCIKTKQGIKFQQNLNILLGKHAYMFSTIYKIFDSLAKVIIVSASCPLTANSFKFAEQEKCQDLYFLLINRYCLATNLTNNKLIRLTYNMQDRVVYFNYMDCYYKAEDPNKDMPRKRVEITRNVEFYTVEEAELQGRKRVKTEDVLYESNQLEYIFDCSTIKMQNHNQNEDLLVQRGRKLEAGVEAQVELRRIHNLFVLTN